MLNSLHSASVAATRTAPLSSETSSVAVSSSTVRASKRQRGEGHVRTAELSTTTTGGLPGSGSVCTWPGMDDYSQERDKVVVGDAHCYGGWSGGLCLGLVGENLAGLSVRICRRPTHGVL